jgi:hypothetical protein
LLTTIAEILQLAICLFRMTVRIFNYETSPTREAGDNRFKQGQIMQFIFIYATGISSHINLSLNIDFESRLPLIQIHYIYVSKDVRIRCYFSKPKGVREQIFCETLNEALRTEYLSLWTRFWALLFSFHL